MKYIRLVLFELKGMKLFRFQLLTSLLVIPLLLFVVQLNSAGANPSTLQTTIVSFIVATIVSGLLGLLALRICNSFLPDVLELYSTMAITKIEMILSLTLTYILLVSPQIIIGTLIMVSTKSINNTWAFIATILLSLVWFSILAIGMGLWIKNYYLIMGIMPLFTLVLLMVSPIYLAPLLNSPVIKILTMLNPISYFVNLFQASLNNELLFPVSYSVVFITMTLLALVFFVSRKINDLYALENY
ncbi:MAG: hypothetical protein WBI14_03315 [Anaerolineaceae bacterium]|jgi:ABC-2 type transport system permease protein